MSKNLPRPVHSLCAAWILLPLGEEGSAGGAGGEGGEGRRRRAAVPRDTPAEGFVLLAGRGGCALRAAGMNERSLSQGKVGKGGRGWRCMSASSTAHKGASPAVPFVVPVPVRASLL